MNDDFKALQEFFEEINSTNATNEKMEIFRKYSTNEFVCRIHEYVYTPFKQYYVTPDNLKKNTTLVTENKYASIFSLLNDLAERIFTGHKAIGLVNGFIEEHKEYEELIYNIFDRNLKTRFTASGVNKVVKGLVPTFDCVLANSYDDRPDKVDFEKEDWYASRKLDGIRCLVFVDANGEVTPYSRTGKEISTIQKVADAIKQLNLFDVVFDGELCIVDENGDEQFQGVVSQFSRKDHQIDNPRYKIFDCIPMEEFTNKEGDSNFIDRYLSFSKLLSVSDYDSNIIDHVSQVKVDSKEELEFLREDAKNYGWEGIMIRKNTGYKGKRTNDLLKCKKFFDAEYVVESVEVGPFRVIMEGREVTEEVVTNVNITHKGFPVSVGSGFSLEQRRQFRDNPNDIVGKEITVMYFEETKDKHGDLSLRFPTFKGVYDGKRFDNE